MSEAADRYRAVAEGFTRRARAVPETAWERPAPCDGWVARDVVGHLVEWIPPFLQSGAGIDETLDAAEVARMFEGIQGIDEMLRQSGQYGPKIDPGEDADLQTQLIA